MPQPHETPAPENPRAWMKDLCAPLDRIAIASPFLVDHNGITYECVTNGHLIVALPGAGETTRRDGPPADQFLAPLAIEIGKTKVRDLCHWGGQVECTCVFCDPAGVTEYRHPISAPFRLGRLHGRLIDRWYVYRALEHFDGRTEVAMRTDQEPVSPIQFFGDGWVAVVMPCRDDSSWVGELFPPEPKHMRSVRKLIGGAR